MVPGADDESVGFFDRPSSHDLIYRISEIERLTIFAGAGVSLDRGSPTWEGLVERCLAALLGKIGELESDSARAIVAHLGSLGAGSAAMQIAKDDERKLPDFLYMLIARLFDKGWDAGGGLARAVVDLAMIRTCAGLPTTILTTNYDDNLERSATESSLSEYARELGVSLEPWYDASAEPDAISAAVDNFLVPVVHLHGFINVNREPTSFTLSEADFARASVGWQNELLKSLLADSAALFIGTSLRDQDIVSALCRSTDERERFAILCAQDVDMFGDAEGQERSQTRMAVDSRVRSIGVRPIIVDYYGQVQQILREITVQHLTGSSYLSDGRCGDSCYDKRLREWWSAFALAVNELDELDELDDVKVQVVLMDALSGLGSDVAEIAGINDPGDWKVELWLRQNPDSREMHLWATSESIHLKPPTRHRATIPRDDGYHAVAAFQSRTTQYGPVGVHSRWNWHFAEPIILTDEPWYDLPVGVINFLSSRPVGLWPQPDDSEHEELMKAERRATVSAQMRALGAEILRPSGPDSLADRLSEVDRDPS